ncbi:nuclear transport factor 2 family protein [Nocardia sp. NPDC004654]|uniref:nuclear transport factor 2 family protein n=1 Tax=Nocardia sp. NPDC004654 TaxID=3154776 RepID=UPI0033BDE9BE
MKKIRLVLPLALLPIAALAACSSTATAADAERREIRELLDRSHITALVDRLGHALDEGAFEDFRQIYTADASATTPGGTAQGVDAMIAQAGRSHSADKKVQHFISNVIVDLRGDTAAVRANLLATFAPLVEGALTEPKYTLGEIYSFDAVRTAEGWRLSRIRSTPQWAIGTRF